MFPTLTVAEHLRLAGWLHRKDKQRVAAATEHVLELFPILRDRLDEPAGNLSGGQQQMLALGMAFIERPRLLMIDELSLGLAPAIVEQLLPLVRDLAAQGHDDHPRRAVGEPRAHRSPRRRTSWRRARSASTARPQSCSSGPTCCARCSSKARRRCIDGSRARTSVTVPRDDRARRRRRTPTDTTDARARAWSLDRVSKRFGGLAALTRRVARRRGRARSSASSARTARARRRCST